MGDEDEAHAMSRAGAVPEPGAVAAGLAAELPGLRLWTLAVAAGPGPSPAGLRERLRYLSDRFTGARALTLRTEPIAQAYRVCFRQVGLDPDHRRPSLEQAAVDRLAHGAFRSRSLLDDALLVALVETGVPVWALDADRLTGALELRLARAEDPYVLAGRIAVADALRPVAELFGPPAAELVPGRATRRIRLFAVAVAGVPAVHAWEALEGAAASLAEAV